MFIWLFEGELEVALHCSQVWSVFSTISAWRSGNRWWQDETDLIKRSHAMAPASAAASGHHLQELGSLTHEKDLGGVMKNLPCSVGYSSCSTHSLFSHNGGKNVFIFIWTCYYLVRCNCSDHVLIVVRAQSWEEAQQNPCWHCHYLAWCGISPCQPRQWKYYYPSQGKFWFKLVLSLLQARAPQGWHHTWAGMQHRPLGRCIARRKNTVLESMPQIIQ